MFRKNKAKQIGVQDKEGKVKNCTILNQEISRPKQYKSKKSKVNSPYPLKSNKLEAIKEIKQISKLGL